MYGKNGGGIDIKISGNLKGIVMSKISDVPLETDCVYLIVTQQLS